MLRTPVRFVNQQYPENRETLQMMDRFRGEVVLLHDENNEHKCTGCTACEIACPNGTIRIVSDQIVLENNKKQKIIDTFVYNLAMCTFCNLCIKGLSDGCYCYVSRLRARNLRPSRSYQDPEQAWIENHGGRRREID